MKRLDIIGIPANVVCLIKDGENSCLIRSNTGTIQGSILGPILNAKFADPLFDLEKLSNYTDDNYIVRWNACIKSLIIDMKNLWKPSQNGSGIWVSRPTN